MINLWCSLINHVVIYFPEHPTQDEIKDFRREIELMKSVGKHKNIVGIEGHFTQNFKEMMLLIEYCGKGNLLNFLR